MGWHAGGVGWQKGKSVCLEISGGCTQGYGMQTGWAMADRLKMFALRSAVVVEKGTAACRRVGRWQIG